MKLHDFTGQVGYNVSATCWFRLAEGPVYDLMKRLEADTNDKVARIMSHGILEPIVAAKVDEKVAELEARLRADLAVKDAKIRRLCERLDDKDRQVVRLSVELQDASIVLK